MKKTKLPNLISILILTVITVLMWISFSVYRAVTSQPTPSVPKTISEPLTPTLDAQTITQIESRLFLDSAQIPDNVVTQVTTTNIEPLIVSTPLPTPEALVESTPSAEPSPSATP